MLSNFKRISTSLLNLSQIHSPYGGLKGYEYERTYILDWDDYRDGMLLGKVKLNCEGFSNNKKLQVLMNLIDAIKTNGTYPSDIEFVGCDPSVINKWHNVSPLKSINLKSIDYNNGEIYEEAFIFIMGSKDEL